MQQGIQKCIQARYTICHRCTQWKLYTTSMHQYTEYTRCCPIFGSLRAYLCVYLCVLSTHVYSFVYLLVYLRHIVYTGVDLGAILYTSHTQVHTPRGSGVILGQKRGLFGTYAYFLYTCAYNAHTRVYSENAWYALYTNEYLLYTFSTEYTHGKLYTWFVYSLYTTCIPSDVYFSSIPCVYMFTFAKKYSLKGMQQSTQEYTTPPQRSAPMCTQCLKYTTGIQQVYKLSVYTQVYIQVYSSEYTDVGRGSHSICIPNVYSKIVYYVCILFVYSFCKYTHSHMYTFSIRVYSSTQEVRYGLGEVCRSELKQRRYSKGIR